MKTFLAFFCFEAETFFSPAVKFVNKIKLILYTQRSKLPLARKLFAVKFYCTTIAYHVGLNALLVAARNYDQRLRKKDIYSWP